MKISVVGLAEAFTSGGVVFDLIGSDDSNLWVKHKKLTH